MATSERIICQNDNKLQTMTIIGFYIPRSTFYIRQSERNGSRITSGSTDHSGGPGWLRDESAFEFPGTFCESIRESRHGKTLGLTPMLPRWSQIDPSGPLGDPQWVCRHYKERKGGEQTGAELPTIKI